MGFFEYEVNGPFGHSVFVLQIIVAGLVAIHILLRKQEPQVCLGWLCAVALFPLLAAIIYVGVGINPFERYALQKRRSKALAGLKKKRAPSAALTAVNEKLSMEGDFLDFHRTHAWVSSLHGQPLLTGNQVDLLINSSAVYPALELAIENANQFILVQFYQIQADAIGFAFLDRLANKAKNGVKVFVLFDALGSLGLKSEIIDTYKARGLQIRRFLEIHPVKRQFQINWRNHRKLIVCDGELAFVGGFNIGNLYLEGPDPKAPKWVDLLYSVRGPAIQDLMAHFSEDWHFTTGRLLPATINIQHAPAVPMAEPNLLMAVPSGPSENNAPFYSTLLQILFEARQRVWIMTPYFVPDKGLLQALRLAVARGVHVRVIIPLRSNHPFTDTCTSSYFHELHAYGVDLLRYAHGVCHAKVILADDDLVLSGSSNMDYRSFYLNFETDLFMRNKAVASKIEHLFREIALMSLPLKRRDLTRMRVGRLLVRRIMRLLAPLM